MPCMMTALCVAMLASDKKDVEPEDLPGRASNSARRPSLEWDMAAGRHDSTRARALGARLAPLRRCP